MIITTNTNSAGDIECLLGGGGLPDLFHSERLYFEKVVDIGKVAHIVESFYVSHCF